MGRLDTGAESANGGAQKSPPGDLASTTAPLQAEKRGSEYLVNERTFPAWIRTSVAVISLGFLVDRFGLFLKELGSAGGQRQRFPPAVTSFLVGDLMMGFGAALASRFWLRA